MFWMRLDPQSERYCFRHKDGHVTLVASYPMEPGDEVTISIATAFGDGKIIISSAPA